MLTAKQRKQLANLPKGRRAQQRAAYIAQNGSGGGTSARDASMLRGIKQGVGKSVPKPFGSIGAGSHHECFDAFHPCHLPLPRAVGPYSTVRTTQIIKSNDPLFLFGPHFSRQNGNWTNICAISSNDENQTFGAAGKTHIYVFDQLRAGTWTGAQVAPSAFSVQLMNPNALQATSGIVYGGRVRTTFKENRSLTSTAKAVANSLVSYNNPRLMSAAKLAFRGVHINNVPFNMSELANFTPIEAVAEQGTATIDGNTAMPYGFAPSFVYNPNVIDLQFLVCCEWRVRFDPSNPAQSTHVYHPPASEDIWHRMQSAMEAMGHGVSDIAETVANVGHTAYNIAGGAVNTIQSARALRAIGGAGMLALGA